MAIARSILPRFPDNSEDDLRHAPNNNGKDPQLNRPTWARRNSQLARMGFIQGKYLTGVYFWVRVAALYRVFLVFTNWDIAP